MTILSVQYWYTFLYLCSEWKTSTTLGKVGVHYLVKKFLIIGKFYKLTRYQDKYENKSGTGQKILLIFKCYSLPTAEHSTQGKPTLNGPYTVDKQAHQAFPILPLLEAT